MKLRSLLAVLAFVTGCAGRNLEVPGSQAFESPGSSTTTAPGVCTDPNDCVGRAEPDSCPGLSNADCLTATNYDCRPVYSVEEPCNNECCESHYTGCVSGGVFCFPIGNDACGGSETSMCGEGLTPDYGFGCGRCVPLSACNDAKSTCTDDRTCKSGQRCATTSLDGKTDLGSHCTPPITTFDCPS